MNKQSLLAGFTFLVLTAAPVAPAAAMPAFELRDTTSLPPPSPGMARFVVTRERLLEQGLKPEFVNVDRTPVGNLPQLAVVTAEVPAGMHRIWLGRGATAEVWADMAAGGLYLIRLREIFDGGRWAGDLVVDAPEGYAQFALDKGMKLAVTSPSGMGAMQRDIAKRTAKAGADSTALAKAIARASLPMTYSEAWYQDLLAPARVPMAYEHDAGRLVIDATSLKFIRGDSVAVDIPRASIESVRYGGHKDNRPNPWIKIGWRVNGEEKGATFAHTNRDSATASYNRLFLELTKRPSTP